MTNLVLFKIIGGQRACEFTLQSISEIAAVETAKVYYNKLGLIGRYYCETESGKFFTVCE